MIYCNRVLKVKHKLLNLIYFEMKRIIFFISFTDVAYR